MKKGILIVSILAILGALAQMSLLLSANRPRFASLPVDQVKTISFQADQGDLRRLSELEQADQLRDWLLFTTVSSAGLPAQQITRSLYDLPPLREGYMRPVGNFDYGETRSANIGDGQLVALIPSGISADQRKDDLAHIADEYRKNTGTMPVTLNLVEYSLDLARRSASLTRRSPIVAKDLFTDAYGYYETQIRTRDDLARFMSKVDDVTFVRNDSVGLTLGGRKLTGSAYRRIQIEDVAAIWQSEQKIQTDLAKFKSDWETKITALTIRCGDPSDSNAYLRKTYPGGTTGSLGQSLDCDQEWTQLKQELAKAQGDHPLVKGSGFSLDPTYDYAGLARLVESLAPDLEKAAAAGKLPIAVDDVRQAEDGLVARNEVPLLKLMKKLEPYLEQADSASTSDTDSSVFALALAVESRTYKFQAARYDGDLQGTEVGMTLFYTDLMAKLWGFDYMHSAPSQAIQGFIPKTNSRLSSIYHKDLVELPNTRLWFGPQNKGFQVADAGQSLLFARTATRLYAASSNPLEPGVEVAPNELNAAFLGWWDDHYEQVAKYEPEYERLNQIMKWSLLISWLDQAGNGNRLSFLQPMVVHRNNWFPEWVQRHPELKYQQWDAIKFKRKGYKNTKTETLPVLFSQEFPLFPDGVKWHLSGGVSLADEALFEGRAALSESLDPMLRRSFVDYHTVEIPLVRQGVAEATNITKLRTLDGLSYDLNLAEQQASVVAKAADTAKLRSIYGELADATPFETSIATNRAGLTIETRAGSTELGGLHIHETRDGFSVAWRSRDMDAGHLLMQRVSAAETTPLKALATDAQVEATIALPDNGAYLVKLRDSDSWLKIAIEKEAGGAVPPGWQSRVSYGDSGDVLMGWVSRDELTNVLGREGYLSIDPVQGTTKTAMTSVTARGPPAGARAFQIQSGPLTIKGYIDPKTGVIYFQKGELLETLHGDVGGLPKLLSDSDIKALRQLAEGPGELLNYTTPARRFADNDRFARLLENEQYRDLAEDLANNPDEFFARLQQHLDEQLRLIDSLAAAGDRGAALQYIDDLIRVRGPHPELTLRKATLLLDEGNIAPAAEALNSTLPGASRNADFFFSEIDARLANTALSELERQNAYALAQFGDWHDLQAAGKLAGGKLEAVADGDRLVLQYHVDGLPATDAVPPAAIPDQVQFVYFDKARLGNLDWNPSIKGSLRQAVEAKFGRVVQLPRQEIAFFRPNHIIVDGKTELELSTGTQTASRVRVPSTYIRYLDGNNCQGVSAQPEQCQVYAVYPQAS